MSAESESLILEQLLLESEAERAAEAAERKALGEKIDALAAKVDALARGGRDDTLLAELKALIAQIPGPQTIKARKAGSGKISFTVVGRDASGEIKDADITIQ